MRLEAFEKIIALENKQRAMETIDLADCTCILFQRRKIG